MYNTIITYIGIHCSAHWQMVIILPKENLFVWFCLLHNRPDNYLKGIINRSVLFFNTFALGLSAIVLGGCRSGVWVYSGIRWRQGLPRRGRDICLSFHVFHGCMKQKREMQEVKSMKRPLI